MRGLEKMTVREVVVPANARAVLPQADFADAYAGTVPKAADALHAARLVLEKPFPLLTALMALRNALVRPFGLVTARKDIPQHKRFIGFFPVLSETPERLVLGVDDRHLDFRLIVDRMDDSSIVATTLVATHGLSGRAYMLVVKPFHRWLVPHMLRRATGLRKV
jgi:hypothetical protein